LQKQARWAYRIGPIVGGIALLAFTGTGDESTDVGAHLLGFVCGFGSGLLLTRLPARAFTRRAQLVSGLVALALPAIAWLAAFSAAG
jgi:membrane associated rhomboid family serine protease